METHSRSRLDIFLNRIKEVRLFSAGLLFLLFFWSILAFMNPYYSPFGLPILGLFLAAYIDQKVYILKYYIVYNKKNG